MKWLLDERGNTINAKNIESLRVTKRLGKPNKHCVVAIGVSNEIYDLDVFNDEQEAKNFIKNIINKLTD